MGFFDFFKSLKKDFESWKAKKPQPSTPLVYPNWLRSIEAKNGCCLEDEYDYLVSKGLHKKQMIGSLKQWAKQYKAH